MATTTLDVATDAIFGTFKVAWDAGSATLNGGVEPTIVYEALEPDLKPHPRDTTKAWVRLVLRHQDSKTVTLRSPIAGNGTRFRRIGLLWIQIFVPNNSAGGWATTQQLAMLARKAFEGQRTSAVSGSPGDVVFTKATMLDRPLDGIFWRYDVKVEFYWDEQA